MSLAIARPPRDVVGVSGTDARSYLQNLVSQDLDPLADGAATHALLLTPQGKLDVDFRLALVGDEVWLVCEGGFGERLVASLDRFKIRVDVAVALRPDLEVVAAIGDAEPADVAEAAGVVRVPSPWPGAVELVAPASTLREVEARVVAQGADQWSAEEYEARRIAAGVPKQGAELDERTIPQEAFLEHAVSFTKGCFLGQELVCRIDTRGHVNRYLRRLTNIDGGAPPPGAEIVAGEKVVGVVTSAADAAALGYVRREVEPPADVTLRWPDGEATARVEA